MAGIYSIVHIPTGRIYIGMSVDIFTRWQSHYSQMRMGTHTSTALTYLWSQTEPSEWSFSVLEYISISEYKRVSQMTGKQLTNGFRTLLLKREKHHMKNHSINLSLNKNNKSFT